MKRLIADRIFIAALLAAGTLLAGCGGSSQSPGTTGRTTVATTQEPATDQPASPSSPAQGESGAQPDSARPANRAAASGRSTARQAATAKSLAETGGDRTSLPADSPAVQKALRSLTYGKNQDGGSAKSVQDRVKKIVTQLKNGDQSDGPASQSDAPAAVEKVLEQLRQTQSP